MFVVRSEYPGQGKWFVGKSFETREEAQRLLELHGWKPDRFGNKGPHGEPEYEREGPIRVLGAIGFSVTEYVYIEEV